MPYIGNIPAEKYASYDVQHITTSATSSYVLDKNVANENEIRVVLNNIIQQPGSSYAYTASGNTLTLSAATTSSDKLYVVFTGKAVQTVTPPPSSVGLAQFNATGSPGTNTFLRGDNSWATPSDSVSYLVKISADDTTPDFLNGKLVAGTGISLTEGSGGGDETLTIANTSTGTITAFTNGVDNRVVTATSTTALNGEANLTFNGTILGVGGTGDLGSGVHIKKSDSGSASVNQYSDNLVIEEGTFCGMSFLTGNSGAAQISFGDSDNDDVGIISYDHNNNFMNFYVNADEFMRIASNHSIQFNYGNNNNGAVTMYVSGQTSNTVMALRHANGSGTSETLVAFTDGNDQACGSIGINPDANTVSYNTSSDYRLKENVNYEFDATTELKKLKPAKFSWKSDSDSTLVEGFLAHEVSDIVPIAVQGTKDETEIIPNGVYNANGNLHKKDVLEDEWTKGKENGVFANDTTWSESKTIPKYQSIDQAKLVPLLVKTIQELEARITTLENA